MTDILTKLKQVAEHDWRTSFLAHTSDTAEEARNEIASLRHQLSEARAALKPFADELDGAWGGLALDHEPIENFIDIKHTSWRPTPCSRRPHIIAGECGMTRLCKDCRHFRPVVLDSSDGECVADHPTRESVVSKVDGKTRWRWLFASTLRAPAEGTCGLDGAWFEAKA